MLRAFSNRQQSRQDYSIFGTMSTHVCMWPDQLPAQPTDVHLISMRVLCDFYQKGSPFFIASLARLPCADSLLAQVGWLTPLAGHGCGASETAAAFAASAAAPISERAEWPDPSPQTSVMSPSSRVEEAVGISGSRSKWRGVSRHHHHHHHQCHRHYRARGGYFDDVSAPDEASGTCPPHAQSSAGDKTGPPHALLSAGDKTGPPHALSSAGDKGPMFSARRPHAARRPWVPGRGAELPSWLHILIRKRE